MNDLQDIRRRDNGTIDVDFYRAGATALRRQAMRDASGPRAALGIALVATVMLGFAAISGSAPEHRAWALQQQADELRSRIDVLSRGNPQIWWRQPDRGSSGVHESALVHLKRQLAETDAAIQAAADRERDRRAAAARLAGAPRTQ